MIRELLGKAFDEGFSSSYDLKESSIDSILNEFNEKLNVQPSANLDQKTLKDLGAYIFDHLPEDVKTIISNDNIWLSGGAIPRILIDPPSFQKEKKPAKRKSFNKSIWTSIVNEWGIPSLNNWANSDYDIYCNYETFNKIKFQSNYNIIQDFSYENKSGYRCFIDRNIVINFIVGNFKSPESIYSDFDLTILCSALNKSHLTMPTSTFEDLILNRLKIHKEPNNEKQKEKTKQRIKKYIQRGFRDCTGYIEQGILSKILKETGK